MDRGCNAHSPCLALESQMVFLLSSSSILLEDCRVEQSLHFRSEHWPIVSNYVFGSPINSDRVRFKRCPVKWSPSELWFHRVREFSANWSDPLSAFGHLAQIARECCLPAERKVDFQDNLQDLLRLRRQRLDPDWRRQVNRAIYRTKADHAVSSSQGSVRVWSCPACAE